MRGVACHLIQQVEGAYGRISHVFDYVSINHCGFHALMPKVVLDLAEIHSIQQKMGGKTMAFMLSSA